MHCEWDESSHKTYCHGGIYFHIVSLRSWTVSGRDGNGISQGFTNGLSSMKFRSLQDLGILGISGNGEMEGYCHWSQRSISWQHLFKPINANVLADKRGGCVLTSGWHWSLLISRVMGNIIHRDCHVGFSESPLSEILKWIFSDLPFASLPRSLPKFGQDIHSLWNLRIKSTHCVLYLCVCVLLHQCQNSFTASLSKSFILCDLSDLMLGLL